MNVVFVSACSKQAKHRTRAVLDGYATRIGPDSWATPITEEALLAVRAALARSASKNTSVACYRNFGQRDVRRVWIVGRRKAFNAMGQFSIGSKHTQPNKQVATLPALVTAMAQLSGLLHDLGKATELFQAKLREQLLNQDPVRHEWVSMRVLKRMLNGQPLAEAMSLVNLSEDGDQDFQPHWLNKNKGLRAVTDALSFAVLTHHRLPAAEYSQHNTQDTRLSHAYFEGMKKHQTQNSRFQQNKPRYFCIQQSLADALTKKIDKKFNRLQASIQAKPPELTAPKLRVLGILSRAYLIMADHSVSARNLIGHNQAGATTALYANTNKDKNGQRLLNQTLDYHLSEVGKLAQYYAFNGQHCQWPGLPDFVTDRLLQSTTNPRFEWQDEAAEALTRIRAQHPGPALVMNVAGTGCGKTRMNAKAAAALNTRPELRFSTALGLRTLTLQTGDAYSQELAIPKALLSCIIGDRTVKKIHQDKKDYANPDENPDELVFDVKGGEDNILPAWLSEYAQANPKAKSLLAPPILVSTIDYLIAAGDLTRQGHHCLALLRLANSDLVLDEIDDYGPKAFVAVLRLVEMAAMLGANVITSSATLPAPMARELARAFESGHGNWAALQGDTSPGGFVAAIISNYLPPKAEVFGQASALAEAYDAYIQASIKQMQGGTKKATIQYMAEHSMAAAITRIQQSITQLHQDNHFAMLGKKVSLGLVRCTYVADVIAVASALAEQMPAAYIATYHAADLVINRSLKEKMLDHLLNRKQGNDHILNSSLIQGLVARAPTEEVIFILVTSPVEEVGRDHDFDWAVIEPNSCRSLVQTAGRVNRHRLLPITAPNIHILNQSFRCLKKGQCDERIHYHQPGFEVEDAEGFNWHSHQMQDLLNEADLANLTAGLRFGTSPLAAMEDEAIANIISQPIQHLRLERGKNKTQWMLAKFYRDFPLREHSRQRTFKLMANNQFEEAITNANKEIEWGATTSVILKEERATNLWLNYSLSELHQACDAMNIDWQDGLRLTLNDYHNKEDASWQGSLAFGFTKISS